LAIIIILEVDPSREYAPFAGFYYFFKCILEVVFFSTSCDSASVTSIASKWWEIEKVAWDQVR
jgi:hypothetical protein